MPIPNRVRYLNKRFTNRLMILLAGRRYSPIALLRHTGRRSGKAYTIPIMVSPSQGGFTFALTYGAGVDWYKNVLAAGQCGLRWHGSDYILVKPEPLDAAQGLMAFPQPERAFLRLVGITNFLRMEVKN